MCLEFLSYQELQHHKVFYSKITRLKIPCLEIPAYCLEYARLVFCTNLLFLANCMMQSLEFPNTILKYQSASVLLKVTCSSVRAQGG